MIDRSLCTIVLGAPLFPHALAYTTERINGKETDILPRTAKLEQRSHSLYRLLRMSISFMWKYMAVSTIHILPAAIHFFLYLN